MEDICSKAMEDIIGSLHPDFQLCCLKLYYDNKDLFDCCPGSTHNHQAWPGGYIDHMSEISLIAKTTYSSLLQIRAVPFSLHDALLALFFHDLEKPWKHDGIIKFSNEEGKISFVLTKLKEYNIELNDDCCNAIKYSHGEGKDYRSDKRIQTPLAAFVHCCDVISARIWFDQPNYQ